MRMFDPLVSIIVPIYKVEPYLRRCLDSIVNQTYSNLEIILIDDGSPDNCPKICDEYSAKDNRVIVIHKENGGLSDARNAGLDICKGEYISFIDSDDWVEKNYVEILLKNIIDSESDISIANHQTFSYSGTFFPVDDLAEGVFSKNDLIEQIFTTRNQYKIAWGKLFKKELFSTLRFPYAKTHEDEYVGFIPYFFANKIVCSCIPLYHYLKRKDSITGSEEEYDYFDSKMEQIRFLVENEYFDLADSLSCPLSMHYLNEYFCKRTQKDESHKSILRFRLILQLFSPKKKRSILYKMLSIISSHPRVWRV